MDPRLAGEKARRLYASSYAQRYRESDEAEVGSENHRHYSSILGRLSGSFGRRIAVLDLGCGTGRYFHCLRSTEDLVGVDVSLDMLREARRPVRRVGISARRVNLVCANLFELELPEQRFDLIYSIGVLGEHSPFDATLYRKLYQALKPDGILFFTVMDRASARGARRLRRRLAEAAYPALPGSWRQRLDERWTSFQLTEEELRAVLARGPFPRYEVARHVCASPRWQGAHHDCWASKRCP